MKSEDKVKDWHCYGCGKFVNQNSGYSIVKSKENGDYHAMCNACFRKTFFWSTG